MDLRLKTGSRPNPEWAIHWSLTGQTHLYGWVEIEALRCQITVSRQERGGKFEVGIGYERAIGLYTVVDDCMQLADSLAPYIGAHVTVRGVTTEGTLAIRSVPFVSLAEQSAWEEYYAGLAAGETVHKPDAPKRDFTYHKVLAANFDQADTDVIFAGFGFRSHAELAGEIK